MKLLGFEEAVPHDVFHAYCACGSAVRLPQLSAARGIGGGEEDCAVDMVIMLGCRTGTHRSIDINEKGSIRSGSREVHTSAP